MAKKLKVLFFTILTLIFIFPLNTEAFDFWATPNKIEPSNLIRHDIAAHRSISSDTKTLSKRWFSKREYSGDGIYFVGPGDKVHLDNGVTVEVKDFSINPNTYFGSEGLRIYLDFFVGEEKLNPLPVSISLHAADGVPNYDKYFFKGYGLELTFPDGNEEEIIDRKFLGLKMSIRLSFSSPASLGAVASPETLFNYCIEHEEYSREACFRYTAYTPVEGETLMKNENVVVIGEAFNTEWYFHQANACYNLLADYLDLEPQNLPIPIRLGASGLAATTTKAMGIMMMGAVTDNVPNEDPNICANQILLHEIAHYFVMPDPIAVIINEGFATHIQHLIDKEPVVVETLQSDLVLQRGADYQHVDGSLVNISFRNTYEDSATFQYLVNLSSGGFYTSPALRAKEGLTTGLEDLFYPIIHVKGLNEYSSVVDIYENAPMNYYLNCREDGFQNYQGWKTSDGRILEADESINYKEPFMPLSRYSSDEELDSDDWLALYKTSACFWRETIQQVDIREIFAEIQKHQSFDNQSFNIIEYLEGLGVNTEHLISKYGINAERAGKQPFDVSLSGNTANY